MEFQPLQTPNSKSVEKLFTRHKATRVLKILNVQGEIHTATDFAFESAVLLHSDENEIAPRSGWVFLHGEWGGSVGPRWVRHPSVGCENEVPIYPKSMSQRLMLRRDSAIRRRFRSVRSRFQRLLHGAKCDNAHATCAQDFSLPFHEARVF